MAPKGRTKKLQEDGALVDTLAGAEKSNSKVKAATGKTRRPARSRPRSGQGTTATNLVVVESPAKARTIERILGEDYVVKASQGHVRDLPSSKLGVDIEREFEPSYSILKDKRTVVNELKKLGSGASSIYLATDPDREGEAISWHLIKAASWDGGNTPLRRVVFHELTQEAVKEAFEHPRDIDMELVNAQQARRILDRLVGYQISPLLWRRVQRGLSAGRVQSVALRMVVERDREILAFVPREYWTIAAQLRKAGLPKNQKGETFTANLQSLKGQKGKLDIGDGAEAGKIASDLEGAEFTVGQVRVREVRQSPSPPFITSTLQQEAWRKLRFTAKRTMAVAQQLYEGLSMGTEGSVGLITYMRTDSTNLAPSALHQTREYIQATYGDEYLPRQPRVFKKKARGAQEAHEAIRPTYIGREPQALKKTLSSDQYRLYDLIWRRMLASQMSEARSQATTVDTDAVCRNLTKTYIFRASGSVLKFPGFRVLYMEGKDDGEEEEGKGQLPELSKGDKLNCLKLEDEQHFTQPPAGFTEATLIKALEEKGIGRPSTYAPIISTIVDRHYVVKEKGKLKSTALGSTVCDLLTQFFPTVLDIDFTARMEEELDEVAQGERQWVPMLTDFYGPFQKTLEAATEAMPRVRVEEATDEVCDKCSQPMVIKTGRFGRFLACTNFPTCRNTRPPSTGSSEDDTGTGAQSNAATDEVCEKCGQPMAIKMGRFGRFLACSNYPACKTTRPMLTKIGVQCPRCGGDLVQRKSRGRGRIFYGCSRYPDCDFLVNQRPLPEPCPECGGLMVTSGREGVKCTTCAWKGDLPEREPVTAEA